jgi:hypothetical protein
MMSKIKPIHIIRLLKRCAPRSIPEERLWIAVIMRAVEDMGRKTTTEAAQYFVNGTYFPEICEMAGLDVHFARGMIARIGEDVDVRPSA